VAGASRGECVRTLIEEVLARVGGRGMTGSEVWRMRSQNGDSQHGASSLNISTATNRNGRLVMCQITWVMSGTIPVVTRVQSLLTVPSEEKIAGPPGREFCIFGYTRALRNARRDANIWT
jgi:hypothetical protein